MDDTPIDFSKIKIELLSKNNYDPTFDCSDEDEMGLNEFYHEQALSYHEERIGRTYVFIINDKIIGFITLAMSDFEREKLYKNDMVSTRTKLYPATLIGRLATDNNYRCKGVGSYMLKWVIGFTMEVSERIGCRYVVLQTDKKHTGWYEKRGFKLLYIEKEDYWLFQKIQFLQI